MNRAMALLDPGLIVANPKFDSTLPAFDPNDHTSIPIDDVRRQPWIGKGIEWLDAIQLSLHQWHWDLCDDGSVLLFVIIKNDVPNFRQKWEDDAPAGALLLPSLLDNKTAVPAKVHGHGLLKKLGVLPTHTTYDVMATVWKADRVRYPLARPDHF